MNDRVGDIETWLDCWLGCADVLVRYEGKVSRAGWHAGTRT